MALTIQWQLTSLCSNRCKHCYIPEYYDDSVSYEKFLEAYGKILDFEEKYNVNVSQYVLTGGDPFMNKDFWRILDLLCDKSIAILGIPERVTCENIHKLKKMNVKHYQVSLDGLPETHDKIRGIGSFERTLKSVKKLAEYGISHNIMYTVNALNYTELIPLIKYLDELGICTDFTFDFMVENFNCRDEGMMIEATQAFDLIEDYGEISLNLRQKNSTVKLREKCNLSKVWLLKNQVISNKEGLEETFCDGCSNGLYGLAILPNGDVYPCRRLGIKIGNLYEQTLEEIFLNNPIMKKFRDSSSYKYCCDCRYFNVCRGCPAISYAWTGDMFARNPYCNMKETMKQIKSICCTDIESIMMCAPNRVRNMSKTEYLLYLIRRHQNIDSSE